MMMSNNLPAPRCSENKIELKIVTSSTNNKLIMLPGGSSRRSEHSSNYYFMKCPVSGPMSSVCSVLCVHFSSIMQNFVLIIRLLQFFNNFVQ